MAPAAHAGRSHRLDGAFRLRRTRAGVPDRRRLRDAGRLRPRGALAQLFAGAPGASSLLVLSAGLVCYSLWRLLQSLLDADDHGRRFAGMMVRTGLFASAVLHLSLALFTTTLAFSRTGLAGSENRADGSWAAWLLTQPLGRVWLFALGAIVTGCGVAIAWKGTRAGFAKWFDMTNPVVRLLLIRYVHSRTSCPTIDPIWCGACPHQIGAALAGGPSMARAIDPDCYSLKAGSIAPICRFGLIARGFALALIGLFLMSAGANAHVGATRGLAATMQWLQARQPFGQWLLAALAADLIAFGVYGLMATAYRQIQGLDRHLY